MDFCSHRFLCALGQNCLSRDGMGPGTDRALEYPGLSEPDLPVLLLMNPEKRPLILGDFKIPPSFLYTYESCSLKFKFGL